MRLIYSSYSGYLQLNKVRKIGFYLNHSSLSHWPILIFKFSTSLVFILNLQQLNFHILKQKIIFFVFLHIFLFLHHSLLKMSRGRAVQTEEFRKEKTNNPPNRQIDMTILFMGLNSSKCTQKYPQAEGIKRSTTTTLFFNDKGILTASILFLICVSKSRALSMVNVIQFLFILLLWIPT